MSYSITTDDRVIKIAKLYDFSSNFSAEIIAIYEACLYVKKQRSKFIICTDSLSTLKSVLNISITNFYTSIIRTILIERFPDLKLIWVPGHCRIVGNKFADNAAKIAGSQPLLFTVNLNRKDIMKQIIRHYTEIDKNNAYNHTSSTYRTINKEKIPFMTI